MASQTTKTQGCSGCLIEAIERHDERKLCELLSAANVEYSDTYWVPRDKLFKFVEPLSNSYWQFPVLLPSLENSVKQCSHPVLEETLMPGEPANIALSVVLSSMLHTTAEFNAFKMVAESRKFEMNEPLIFHMRHKNEIWSIVIVDTAGMALLLDKGTDFDDANSFLLLKTLV